MYLVASVDFCAMNLYILILNPGELLASAILCGKTMHFSLDSAQIPNSQDSKCNAQPMQLFKQTRLYSSKQS